MITRAGWLVTHIYEHYTFEQLKFKTDFVVMNQKSRQTATSNVEKDFHKLLNHSNFGIDCRNNIDNCYVEPIYGDFAEISYIKNYTTIFNDDKFRDFFLPCLVRKEMVLLIQKYLLLIRRNPLMRLEKKYYEKIRAEVLDGVDSYEKNTRVKKRKFQDVDIVKFVAI